MQMTNRVNREVFPVYPQMKREKINNLCKTLEKQNGNRRVISPNELMKGWTVEILNWQLDIEKSSK